MNYKNTLNLPTTAFSMKADLCKKEPAILEGWKKEKIYRMIRERQSGSERFVLHDGPPYANGRIHMGHVLNKILKDITVKFYTMKGYDAPYVPGWDCHGLPVEHQLFIELGIGKGQIGQVEFRKKAREYALRFVTIQRDEFERLGVFGDWDEPYLTLDAAYEAAVIRSFAHLVEKGYVYRGLKPVNWCTTCETALAEAEVEYEDHASPSIYFKFRVTDAKGLPSAGTKKTFFVVWTTTPWTLLGNVAIALHPELHYLLLEAGDEVWVMVEPLAEATMKLFRKPVKVLGKIKGKELEGIVCEHPFVKRDSVVVLADYVSSEEGTGCVHTAPGHGQEDYGTGKKYGLPMIMPVDEKGVFDATCGEFSGLAVRDANKKIIERMKKDASLLHAGEITHSYPHCWRCKDPIIFRATEQYFVNIDHKGLRTTMLGIIKKVRWYPEAGQGRISSMVENRPDWCLSRQRYWGVPIVAFRCRKCREILLDHTAIEHVAGIVEKAGADAWFIREARELLPPGTVCGSCRGGDLAKETDIIDVWFESGVSHQAVLKENRALGFPCDLYLEGSDQHRGWFQSALITASAIDGTAPYRSVLTHGFVVDGEGKKMSKSLGNVISPQEVMKKYGADILRLWVASSNYHDDIRLSEEILQRLADAYRKMRNTLRFLLGNISDFDPSRDRIGREDMLDIDRWMLSRLAAMIRDVEKNYRAYSFHKIYRTLHNFCVYEISSVYLDILKDRLYTFHKDCRERRSCQTVLYESFTALCMLLAPILSFTAEEAWRERREKDRESGSIFTDRWRWDDETLTRWRDAALEDRWARLLEIREEVLKALETKRTGGGIGSPLEAKVILYSKHEEYARFLKENESELPALFITSQVECTTTADPDMKQCEKIPLSIRIEKASGTKCQRCWNYRTTVGTDDTYNDICSRCVEVVRKLNKEG